MDNNIGTTTLANALEHTILGDDVSYEKIIQHIKDAVELGVCAICIPLEWVAVAKKELAKTSIKIVTVVDFPLGQNTPAQKGLEAFAAKSLGADEIDMVIDYNALINKDYSKVLEGITKVVENSSPSLVKVIIETSALDKDQIAIACALVSLGNAKFIKTSTGFHKSGAQVSDIALMRKLLPSNVLIKASGGVKDTQTAIDMIKAGANRIGASKSRQILNPSI